ncbi:hypothetical protein AAEX28_07895 [Lentisphaerota bacterium WC36G]|nr:hypothetical protein LJT99_10750 [Lentisphaerae bacterium WC36]
MKRFLDIFVMLFMIALFPGCMSINENDSDYTVDRKRDFNDIFTLGGIGLPGGKVQAGPILLNMTLFLPFRGRDFTSNSYLFGEGAGIAGMELVPYEKINWARNKNYKAISIAGISYAEPLNQNIWSYYTKFEGGAGIPLAGPYLGFNPGELLDWSLGYFGIDIYDDDIGLPPTFEKDLLALNKFFIENNGNLSLTDDEQTVICHEYENARVYEFENYSLAVFPLYWQKYGVYDFIVFINDSIPKCERLTNFGAGSPKYNPNNPIFTAKYKVGFFNKFLGNELPNIENNEHHRNHDNGSINKDYTDIEHKNGEDTYIKNKLAVTRLYGNFDIPGIKKVNLVNSDITNPRNNFQNNYYIIGDLQSEKSIKITLPINHNLQQDKSK